MAAGMTLRAILYGTLLRLRRESPGKRFSAEYIRAQTNSFSRNHFHFSMEEIVEGLESLADTYPLTLELEGNRLGWLLESRQRHEKYTK